MRKFDYTARPLVDCALHYAALGFAVFPLAAGTKSPLKGSHGCKDATTDPEKIRVWWAKNPRYNIAIATGDASGGLAVLDVDRGHEDGVDGAANLRSWADENGITLPTKRDTAAARTPHGGLHIYLRGDGIRNAAGILPGVDLRGTGGLVAVPPSIVDGKRYEWIRTPDDGAIIPAGSGLAALIAAGSRPGSSGGFELPEMIPEGRRTSSLVALVFSLRRKGLSAAAIRAAVRETNAEQCEPPLDDAELEAEVFPALSRELKDSPDFGPSAADDFADDGADPRDAEGIASQIEALEGGKIFRVTDQDCAQLVADLFPECRYNQTARDWYYYDGTRWAADPGGMMIARNAKRFAHGAIRYAAGISADADDKSKFLKAAAHLLGYPTRDKIIKDAREIHVMNAAMLDRDPDLLNLPNGTMNLRTLKFYEHDPARLLSKVTRAEYHEGADSPEFRKFYEEIMEGDEDKMRFTQKALGYSLLGRPTLETFFICYGPTTRNGKSTLLSSVLYLLGDYGANVMPETFAQVKRDSRGPSSDIARLKGVRFVNISEPEKGLRLNEALIKSMVAGGVQTARKLNENEIEFRPQAVFWWDCNYLPGVADRTIFDSDRVHVIPFTRHFSRAERDLTLKERLQQPENLAGILNWLLDGLRMYRADGLEIPEAVKAATDQYREDSDRVANFLREEMTPDAGALTAAADVYIRYREWALESGLQAAGKFTFFKAMRERGLLLDRATLDGAQVHNVVAGYKLQPDEI